MIDTTRAGDGPVGGRGGRLRRLLGAVRCSTSAGAIAAVVVSFAVTAGAGALTSAALRDDPQTASRLVTASASAPPTAPTPAALSSSRTPPPRRGGTRDRAASPPASDPAPVAPVAPASTVVEALDRPALSLVVSLAQSGEPVVAPQVAHPTACGELVGEVTSATIRVDGVRYDSTGSPCPKPRVSSALVVPVTTDRVRLAMHYADGAGTYVIDRSTAGVTVALEGGDDVAPPRTASWWFVPADLVAVRTEASDPRTVEAVAGRVEGELLNAGSKRFTPPEGEPIVGGLAPRERWREHVAIDGRMAVRLYRSPLDESAQRRAAENAVARTECATLVLLRPTDQDDGGIRVGSRCARRPERSG